MDTLGGSLEKKPFMSEKRTQLLAAAEGSVLEVGGGTGFNLPYYPAAVTSITVTDPVDGMLGRTRARATKLGKEITATKAGAEELPFEDGSFDTVLASLVLCSVGSQERALAEMRRVLKPGGHYLFLEHVRSDDDKDRASPGPDDRDLEARLLRLSPEPRHAATHRVRVHRRRGRARRGPALWAQDRPALCTWSGAQKPA